MSHLSPAELAALSHWSLHGQPGPHNTSQNTATSSGPISPLSPSPLAPRILLTDWRTSPNFNHPVIYAWSIPLHRSQIEILLRGFKPKEMEDKWFMCAEEVESGKGQVNLVLCRSWTGKKIAVVKMEVYDEERNGKLAQNEEGEEERREHGGRITGLVFEGDENVVRVNGEEARKYMVREALRWVLGVKLDGDN